MSDALSDSAPLDPLPELVAFFKALIEPDRLRVAALIIDSPLTQREAGERTGMGTRAARDCLRTLEDAGYARVEGSGAEARYRLDTERMRRLAATLLESPRIKALGGATDERSRVLASFFRDGRLTRLPTGDRRRLIILEEIATRFASGRTYSEREVNAILRESHEDYATIRRYLVDLAFLNRQDGVYWVGEGRRSPAAEGS